MKKICAIDDRVAGSKRVNEITQPVLRWAGSKQKLVPFLSTLIPDEFGTYYEPFVGSARLFFALKPRRAVLSDINQDLISTYRSIKANPGAVHALASGLPIDASSYYRIRDQHNPKQGRLMNAARFVYLNRYCFNGVYRTNRAGHFNVPRGTGVGQFPSLQAFRQCAQSLRHARLLNADFQEALDSVQPGDFVYLDPPYAKASGRFRGEYGYHSFSSLDVARLLSTLTLLDRKRAKFMLSYSYCREILPALQNWPHKTLLVKRQVAGFCSDRKSKKEVVIANFHLKSRPATKSL